MSLDLYPSIDLRTGEVVRLYQGDFDQQTTYGADPVAVAQRYAEAGAPWVHVVDLDAARGTGSNRDLVLSIARATDAPVQSGGGVRDASLLEEGVARIVVGSAIFDDEGIVGRLSADHPDSVSVGLDHLDGEVHYRGWEAGSGRQLHDLAAELAGQAPASYVVTNIRDDGTLAGPDIDGLRRLTAATTIPVIASGGVGSLDDLRALHDTGVVGVIVGRALYEGAFTIDEAVAACDR
jgi:phosphoribosylformimino-5-aminoimidazole carboxamide ribotide isomerase